MTRWRRKESRTIPIPGNRDRGNGLDYQQWFRCWNCGFINKLGVDALGGDSSSSGIYPQDYTVKEDPFAYSSDVRNSGLQPQAVLDGPNILGVVLALGPDGLPLTIAHSFEAQVSGGCRLCGTLNWKGEI